MSPVAHWSEADYYRASRRARAAWEATQPQLTLGLEGADAGTTYSLVASAPSSPNNGLAGGDRSPTGVEGSEGRKRRRSGTQAMTPKSPPASPPSPADTAPSIGHSSGRGEGGLDNPTTRETPWA